MFAWVLKLTVLFLFLSVTSRYSVLLGSAVFAVLAIFWTQIPLISMLTSIIDKLVRLTFLFKIIGWAIAASGPLIGYYCYRAIYGEATEPAEFMVILFVSTASILNILHSMILFVPGYNVKDSMAFAKSLFGNRLRAGGKSVSFQVLIDKASASMSRALFLDTYIPQLLRVFTSFALAIFAAGQLGLIEHVGTRPPTLVECLQLTFSLLDLGGSTGLKPFTGGVWNGLTAAFTLFLFFSTVLFLHLASSTVDEGLPKPRDNKEPSTAPELMQSNPVHLTDSQAQRDASPVSEKNSTTTAAPSDR